MNSLTFFFFSILTIRFPCIFICILFLNTSSRNFDKDCVKNIEALLQILYVCYVILYIIHYFIHLYISFNTVIKEFLIVLSSCSLLVYEDTNDFSCCIPPCCQTCSLFIIVSFLWVIQDFLHTILWYLTTEVVLFLLFQSGCYSFLFLALLPWLILLYNVKQKCESTMVSS